MQFPFTYLVCINVEVLISEKELSKNIRWSLDHCTFEKPFEIYKKNGKFAHRCCLTPGNHILTCENSDLAIGWNHAKIVIEGHSYCDDFLAYKAMRIVAFTGNPFLMPMLS